MLRRSKGRDEAERGILKDGSHPELEGANPDLKGTNTDLKRPSLINTARCKNHDVMETQILQEANLNEL